jgi:DNA polymerase (family X)
VSLTNAALAELMLAASEEQDPGSNRQKALQRAARHAYFSWPEEAAAIASAGRQLTELWGVGPWVARALLSWLADPPDAPAPSPLRRGFLTLAEARSTLAEHHEWRELLRADLQMHTTDSDGANTLREMVDACVGHGYQFIGITDHSKGLKIARGMAELGFEAQAVEIGALNRELAGNGQQLRVLRSIEMNLSPDGEGDMDPAALARLDLVLGAFHSKLRLDEDQTTRALAAVRNPTVHVLAHPRGRRFNARLGVLADWPKVMEAAAVESKALEIDAFPDRQDLDVELLEVARETGVRISIGTDAHSVAELRSMEFGLAAAIRAGIPRDRILNFLPREEVLSWAAEVRRGGG